MNTHKEKAAGFLVIIFAAVMLVISATTSFGFFYEFFNALVPPALFGSFVGAIISGVVGVIMFDLLCVVYLNTFLYHADTPERRAITLIMTIITFIGAAGASVAHMALTATGGSIVLDPGTRQTIGILALVTAIGGVILNFGAWLAYNRYSQENKERVRESDRWDEIQKAEEEQAKYLDQLVAKDVKDILTKQAPELAALQAERIAAQFYRHEAAKYGSNELPSANGQQPAAAAESPEPVPTETRPRRKIKFGSPAHENNVYIDNQNTMRWRDTREPVSREDMVPRPRDENGQEPIKKNVTLRETGYALGRKNDWGGWTFVSPALYDYGEAEYQREEASKRHRGIEYAVLDADGHVVSRPDEQIYTLEQLINDRYWKVINKYSRIEIAHEHRQLWTEDAAKYDNPPLVFRIKDKDGNIVYEDKQEKNNSRPI